MAAAVVRKPRMPDPMLFAISIVEGVTGESLVERPKALPEAAKDPAAVARGAKGGKVGGRVRAAKMTKAERSASAKKAASARWASVPAKLAQASRKPSKE